jgi:glycerol uptake facilitator-like aquaporin
VAEGHPGFVLGDFASNGFGDLSPGHYNLVSGGPAIFAGKAYIDQLWFFWAAPISGGLVAGVLGGLLFRREAD